LPPLGHLRVLSPVISCPSSSQIQKKKKPTNLFLRRYLLLHLIHLFPQPIRLKVHYIEFPARSSMTRFKKRTLYPIRVHLDYLVDELDGVTALSLRLADLFGVAAFVVNEAEDVERHGNVDEGCWCGLGII
jgi:hypothetical protein